MSKSLIDILLEEAKRSFYLDFYLDSTELSSKAVVIAWMEYQVKLIQKTNK